MLVVGNFHSHGIEIDCRFDSLNSWYFYDEDYTCIVENFRDIDNKELTVVTGNHMIGKVNEDVTAIFTHGTRNFIEFPSGVGRVFPNIKGIAALKMNLTSISSDDLRQFPNLEDLDLSYNHITSLTDDLFSYTPNLMWISFRNNTLESVGKYLLDGLDNMDIINFENNVCINYKAKETPEYKEMKRRFGNCTVTASAT